MHMERKEGRIKFMGEFVGINLNFRVLLIILFKSYFISFRSSNI